MSITFRTTVLGGPTLNLANANAAKVMELLGIPDEQMWDCCRPVPGEDFLGRVLVATALLESAADDENGTPGVVSLDAYESWGDDDYVVVSDRGRWVECGRPPGYLAEKLGELRVIAEYARDKQAHVAWS